MRKKALRQELERCLDSIAVFQTCLPEYAKALAKPDKTLEFRETVTHIRADMTLLMAEDQKKVANLLRNIK